MRSIAAALVVLVIALPVRAQDVPIFDAHLHYSHDAWEMLPVESIVEILRKAGIKRALVSSSDDAGQRRLHAALPDVIIPALRPYRRRGETGTWMRDDTVIPYLEEHLKKYRYVAVGEFHLYGADADLPVPRRMVELAKERSLFLHAHSDAEAVERLFKQWPQARILWAHAGFDTPKRVAEMLRKYPALWCDLAFRTDHSSGGKVDPDWRAVFLEFPDRFLVGTDTFTPERWHYVPEHAKWSRAWLADLPKDIAERIAWKNGETVFGGLLRAPR